MKSIFLSSLSLLSAMLSIGTARADQVTTGFHLGYCHGRMDAECQFSHHEEGAVSVAIEVSPTEVNRYADNRIVALSVAIHSKIKVDSLAVWVASSLDEPLLTHTLARRDLQSGWNTIELSAPYTIPTDQPLFLGYTYWQSAQSYVVSAPPMQSALAQPFWMKVDDESWTQPAQTNQTLSLEAILEGETLPQHDLQLTHLSLVSDTVQSGQDLYLTGNLRVNGLQPVSLITVQAEGEAFESFDLDIPLSMQYGEEHSFCLRIPSLAQAEVAAGQLAVRITGMDELEDEWPTDNTLTHPYSAQPSHWLRTVLCEEFTSEPCGNCPRVANWLSEAAEQYPLAHRVVMAAHHVGFADDWLTLAESEPLTTFFNGTSFNPAIMCDRQYDPTADHIAYLPQSVKDITNSWEAALTRPTSIAMSLEGKELLDKTLLIDVSGVRKPDSPLINPHLTLMLVEDSIKAIYQSNADRDWIHQHTVRYISDTWGEPIEWESDAFTSQFSFELPAGAVPSHCILIAFVSEYSEVDKERFVENTIAVPLANAVALAPQSTLHISTLTDKNAQVPAVCHNLQGQVVDPHSASAGIRIYNGHKFIITK